MSVGSVSGSVLDAIGGTPLVRLGRLWTGPGEILAKLDYLNPGGSKKDRIALRMIEEAEESGVLAAGQTVVELTSGNTGTGLAVVCAVKGYPFVAVMSKGNSEERAQMMTALGAEVVLVDQMDGSASGHVTGDDLALVEETAQRLTEERGAFRADQFHLPGNANAHEFGTGPELWEQSDGTVDVFCEFVGTGGTFVGITRYLKSQNPDVACYLIEPSHPPYRQTSSCQPCHQAIAWSRTEAGPDVEACGDPMENQGGCQKAKSQPQTIGSGHESQCGIDDEADDDDV